MVQLWYSSAQNPSKPLSIFLGIFKETTRKTKKYLIKVKTIDDQRPPCHFIAIIMLFNITVTSILEKSIGEEARNSSGMTYPYSSVMDKPSQRRI